MDHQNVYSILAWSKYSARSSVPGPPSNSIFWSSTLTERRSCASRRSHPVAALHPHSWAGFCQRATQARHGQRRIASRALWIPTFPAASALFSSTVFDSPAIDPVASEGREQSAAVTLLPFGNIRYFSFIK
jgi:hypothetical protein